MKQDIIVTISRQYGSGGRYVGKLLAEKMGVPVYDKSIIAMTAEKCGFSQDFVNAVEEKPTNKLFYAMQAGRDFYGGLSMNDKIFIEQSNIIKEIAAKGSAVIVGRAAGYVLDGRVPIFRVFIHSSIESRIKRAVNYYGLSQDDAEKAIKKHDKIRRNYLKDYAEQNWTDATNYDLSIDSDKVGVENAAEIILRAIQSF